MAPSTTPSRRFGLALAAGGTAGHVTIALAIAEAFLEAMPETEVLFLGTRHGAESALVPARGFHLELLPGAPFQRQPLHAKAQALWQTARALAPARRQLERHSARLVIGTGGYASLGVLVAARSLRVRTVLHEPNAVPGLANRLLGRIVDRVYVSHEGAAASFPADRRRTIGTPLRAEIEALARRAKSPPPRDRAARVLVTAGSEGSPFLDRETPALVREVARLGVAVEVRHQVGIQDPSRPRAAYEAYGVPALVQPFIDDMAAAYEWADLAIACCGAGTVAELAAVGLPCLLVPLGGAAEDHQRRNAELYAARGNAWWVTEDAWRAAPLAARAVELLRSPAAWIDASRSLRALAVPNAAAALVEDCARWMTGER